MTPNRWLTPEEIEVELEEARNRPDRDPDLVEAMASLVSKGLITAFYKSGVLYWVSTRLETPAKDMH